MSIVSSVVKRPPVVMGIDANTHSMAFAILKEDKLIHYGKIEFNEGSIYDKIRDAGARAKAFNLSFDIDYVCIESAVFVNSQQVAIKLAYVYGAIISSLMNANSAEVIEVAPISWQSFIGNKNYSAAQKKTIASNYPDKSASWVSNHIRDLRKQFTLDFFNEKFNINLTDNDVGDAIGIAWYAYQKSLTNK